ARRGGEAAEEEGGVVMDWREEFKPREGESPADHLERLQRRKDEIDQGRLVPAAQAEALSRALRDAKQAAKGMSTLDQLKCLWRKATAQERQAFFLWNATVAQSPARAPGRRKGE